MFSERDIRDYDISSIYDSLRECEEGVLYRAVFNKDHSRKECEALARLIASNNIIHTLRFDRGSFAHGESLSDAIKNVTSIESLEIDNSPAGMEHIVAGIRDNKSITTVAVTAPQPSNLLFEAIEHNTVIQSLRLTHYEAQFLSSKTMESIKQMLIGNTTLTSFWIENAQVESSDGWKFLAEGLKANRGCREISLHSCAIDSTNMALILGALEMHPTVTKLDLMRVPITDAYPSLNMVLKNNAILKYMELSSIGLDVKRLNGLADGIRSNKALKTLKLDIELPADQWKSSGTIRPFFNALKENSTIEDFRFNGFAGSDDSARSVIETLMDHTSINTIDMYSSTFSKNTAQYLLSRLKNNQRIKSIDFTMPPDDPKLYDMVADIIRANNTLTTLYFNGSIAAENFSKLCAALKENESLTNIRMGTALSGHPDPVAAVKDMFTVNYSITWIALVAYNDFNDYLLRNKELQKENCRDLAVLLHNIGRSTLAKEMLPVEIWILVFKYLRSPGFSSFENLAKKILLKSDTKQ